MYKLPAWKTFFEGTYPKNASPQSISTFVIMMSIQIKIEKTYASGARGLSDIGTRVKNEWFNVETYHRSDEPFKHFNWSLPEGIAN